jgi:hypothetical protein
VVQTNQSFSLCNQPAFQVLYKSMGRVCHSNSDHTIRRYAESRFNSIRKEQAALKPQAHYWILDWPITSFEPCADWTLQCWKANAFHYKQMAVAARDLLAIPCAEVDVERLFSEGRDIIGIRRMALGADTMRMVMLMKSHFNQIDKKKRAIAKAKQVEHTALYGAYLN